MRDSKDFPESVNCQACGAEHLAQDLRTVKLSGFTERLTVCESCLSKTAEASFVDAAELLDEIVLIARATSFNPEQRLREIKALVGE